MAKEDAGEEGQARAAQAAARRQAQQYRQVARVRRKKRTTARIILIVGGLGLGASIAASATVYAPALLPDWFPKPYAPAVATAAPPPASPTQVAKAQGPQPLTGPAQAIDGATLTVAGRTIRLQGIEAPPVSLVCRTSLLEYRCGDVARRVLDSFADGAPVACTPAGTATTAAGTVAVCRNRRGWDMAAMEVEAGWAIVQGTLGSSPYRTEQARAEAHGLGLWPNFGKPDTWVQAAR